MEATDFINSLSSYLKNFHPKVTSGQGWGSFNFMKKEAQAILDDLQFSGFFFAREAQVGENSRRLVLERLRTK